MSTKKLYLAGALAIAAMSITGQSQEPGSGTPLPIPVPEKEEKEKTIAEHVQIAQTPSRGPLERTDSIEILGGLTEPEKVRNHNVGEVLLKIARNTADDLFVRIAAMEAISKLSANQAYHGGTAKYIPIFIAMLKDAKEHSMIREGVVTTFQRTLTPDGLVDKDAFRVLVEIVRSKTTDEGLRIASIEAVGAFGSTEGIDVLVPLLSDPNTRVREITAGSMYTLISKLPDAASLPVPAINKLVEMVGEPKLPPDLKVNVMKVVAQLAREGVLAANNGMGKIKDIAAKDQNPKLVKGAIEALGIWGSADAVPALKQAYTDYLPERTKPDNAKDTEMREAVMGAVVSVLSTQAGRAANGKHDAKAVTESRLLLVKTLDEDPSVSVKTKAIFAMRYLYPDKFKAEHKEAVQVLVFMLNDKGTSDDTKARILKSLQAITRQNFGTDGKRWEEWAQKP